MSTKRCATLILFLTFITFITLGAARTANAKQDAGKPKPTTVDCSSGQSVNKAISRAKPGDTILVAGTCHERIVITKPIVLDGGGSATIDGEGAGEAAAAAAQAASPEFDGLVVIDGLTGVHLIGLTIQNSPTNAIVATHGAAVILRNITTQNNALTGLLVIDNATAEAVDCTTRFNRLGFDVVTSSSLILKGAFTSTNNATNGGDINGDSIVELRGAHVTLNDNQQFGVIAGSSSHIAVFGWDAANGSTLSASGNLVAGIGVADSRLTTFSDTVITLTNNGMGLLVASNGHVASPPFANATFVMHGNGVGMNLRSGAIAFIVGKIDIHDNTVGVLADEASLFLQSGVPSAIANNGSNVQLAFGSRSTILNVTVGSPLVCDATVLSRGTTVCP